ncbi:RNA polymerase sigma factor SigX [Thermoanaerobacterium thermosaccharolyticum]|jgi:RNA polymerase sigma factor (sigma-70 family)
MWEVFKILDSFKDIFEKYYFKIYRQIALIINDDDNAQDIAQEVFIKLIKNPPHSDENIGGWLSKVAINQALNFIRSEKNLKSREIKVSQFNDDLISPEDIAIEKIEIDKVRKVLSKMDKRDMLCLVLKHSGYSYEEISISLGIKKSSVGTTVARAHRKFKELYVKEV